MPVDATTIAEELHRMAGFLREPVTLNLIGGCNMALRGIKATTRDADAVLHPSTAWGSFVESMEANDYDWTDRNEVIQEILDAEARATQGWATMQGPIDWDFFPGIDIFDGLVWSDGFAQRAQPFLRRGHLTVNLADKDSLFMLKSVTGRWRKGGDRDIEDLESLLAAGPVDWAFINEEWQSQLANSRHPGRLRSTANDAMGILAQRGYRVHWTAQTPPKTPATPSAKPP